MTVMHLHDRVLKPVRQISLLALYSHTLKLTLSEK